MSTRKSLTFNSSTTSGGHLSVETTHQILHKIRETVFDVNLIQLLESNASACHGIKDLRKKVNVLNIFLEVAYIFFEHGFLLDQISTDLLRKQDATNKINNKMETQEATWDEFSNSSNKVDYLEQSYSTYKKEFNLCATNISEWK